MVSRVLSTTERKPTARPRSGRSGNCGFGGFGPDDVVLALAGAAAAASAPLPTPDPTTSAATAPLRSRPRRDIALFTMSPKYSLSLSFGTGWKQASAQRY